MMSYLKYFLLLCCAFGLSACDSSVNAVNQASSVSPDSCSISSNSPLTKTQFIDVMASCGRSINDQISLNRKRLLQMDRQPKPQDRHWVLLLAKQYGIQNPDLNNDKTWESLGSRVDVVPLSLLVAQAINESNWGRSRFAREGNNYFGQHCLREGCGMIPRYRPEGQTFEVRRFDNVQDSVTQYINNFNTSSKYQTFRKLRAKLRANDETISGYLLAPQLKHYSERREGYVRSIRSIIQKYHLQSLD